MIRTKILKEAPWFSEHSLFLYTCVRKRLVQTSRLFQKRQGTSVSRIFFSLFPSALNEIGLEESIMISTDSLSHRGRWLCVRTQGAGGLLRGNRSGLIGPWSRGTKQQQQLLMSKGERTVIDGTAVMFTYILHD